MTNTWLELLNYIIILLFFFFQGPLTIYDRKTKSNTLVGLVAWGPTSIKEAKAAAFFTRIDKKMEWINGYLDKYQIK